MGSSHDRAPVVRVLAWVASPLQRLSVAPSAQHAAETGSMHGVTRHDTMIPRSLKTPVTYQ